MKTKSFILPRLPRMMGCVVASTVVLMVSASALACIGETEAQIEKRYGKPLQVDNKALVGKVVDYKANGYVIGVFFIDGTSQAENIKKDQGAPFSPDELRIFLENNGAGQQWNEVHKDDQSKQEWWRADEQVHAICFRVDNRLFITTLKYEQGVTAAAKSRAAEKLKSP